MAENLAHFNLEPLGILAVQRTQECVVSLRRQAADHARRAQAVEAEARKAEEQTLAALGVELGISMPSSATFRLVGSVLEVAWDGPRALVFGDRDAEEPTPEIPPNENEEQTEAEDDTAPAETEAEAVSA